MCSEGRCGGAAETVTRPSCEPARPCDPPGGVAGEASSPHHPSSEAPGTDEVLALWRNGGERIALRACAESLRALRRGSGGFYQAEDLLQDLFIRFWMLAQRMACDDAPHEALWQAWRRYLQRGGHRVLRLAPQRLWQGREWVLTPETLELDSYPGEEGDASPALSSGEREQLVQEEDALRHLERIETIDALEESLGHMRPSSRQVLYLLAIRGLSVEEVARRLGLSANAVRQRAARARKGLAGRMARPDEDGPIPEGRDPERRNR